LNWQDQGDDLMVSIFFFFWLLVGIFAIIGAMRGWAKEILVSFSIFLALFLVSLLENYVPFFQALLQNPNPDQTLAISNAKYLFGIRSAIVLILAFFGYQTPSLQRFVASEKFNRERLQDALLGFVLGCVNGFLIVGTIWFYFHQANYPYPNLISPPPDEPTRLAVERLAAYLPPRWLGIPGIYFAVAVAFIFVLIVFI
jgi:uncharacterized membrane protein required for colicin V production